MGWDGEGAGGLRVHAKFGEDNSNSVGRISWTSEVETEGREVTNGHKRESQGRFFKRRLGGVEVS